MSAPVIVIGGGISGLATAWHLRQRRAEAEVIVLEADSAPGGTARSRQVSGFTVDLGPNGFLTNVTSTLELARALGLGEALLPADPSASRRLLARDGELVPLPLSPPSFLKSPLLSPAAKARVLLEPLMPSWGQEEEETVLEFAARRLGREFADAFVRPMVIGITAGDAAATSLDALFPRMRQMEAEYGGLFAAMVLKQLRGSGGGDPSGGRLTSFAGGVGVLTAKLAESLGGSLRLETPAASLERVGAGWRVTTTRGETLEAAQVVLALPSARAAALLRRVAPEIAGELDGIQSADVRVLALGFEAGAFRERPDGFGFLVPRGQGVRMLGCLWTSSIFPPQAPQGKVLMRTMWGGVHDPAIMGLSLEALLEVAQAELGLLMGLREAPVMTQDIAWRQGIPQYTRGHRARVRRIERALERVPGLHLTGNGLRGVGLNDCTRDAGIVAAAVG